MTYNSRSNSQELFTTDSVSVGRVGTYQRKSDQIVCDSITTQQPRKPQIYYDQITCIREEKSTEQKRNHTAPLQQRPPEFTNAEALKFTELYARTGDKTDFQQLPTELKIKTLFTTDTKKNTPLNISLITGQKQAYFEFIQLISTASIHQQQLQAYLNYPNITGRSTIHLAAMSNDERILSKLLDTKAVNINAVDMRLRTAFHYLSETRMGMPPALRGNPFAIYALNSHDSEGQTPVHIAIERQNVKLLEAYISMGAELTLPDKKGQYTPLQYAARAANPYFICMILASKRFGDIDYQSPDGLTALHIAVSNNNIVAAQYLLQFKADPLILRFGNSLLSYTNMSRNREMAKALYNGIADNEKWVFLNSRIDYQDDFVEEY